MRYEGMEEGGGKASGILITKTHGEKKKGVFSTSGPGATRAILQP